MAEFTFLELHLHEGAISGTAHAPFSGLGESEETDGDHEHGHAHEHEHGHDHGHGGGKGLLTVLLGLGVAAVVAWKLLGGSEAEED